MNNQLLNNAFAVVLFFSHCVFEDSHANILYT